MIRRVSPEPDGPSELDQMLVFVSEQDLGLPETTLPQLEDIVAGLPFEAAMLNVAVLQARIEPVLTDAAGQRAVASDFYANRNDLLARFDAVLRNDPGRTIFSPQPLTLLMRVLIERGTHTARKALTPREFERLQDAVLGAHSAIETALDALPLPTPEAKLAYEIQAATIFRRPPLLEEMSRQGELMRLATTDERLTSSKNRVPVDEWLAASGLDRHRQWALGFGLASITNSFGDQVTPLALGARVTGLLEALGMSEVSPDLPVIASSRKEFQERFAALSGGPEAMGWEVRPFKTTPFLRLANGDLLLLATPWMLSWVGEGFHYRTMSEAQRSAGGAASARYTRFIGEVVERYALDLAESAIQPPVRALGEQRYGRHGGQLTSDLAIVSNTDLVLFEINARRVAATAAVTGTVADATLEISRLLVEKADQVGGCISALLSGEATLPDVDMSTVKRIWPVVVSVGHVMQTSNLWSFLRASLDPEKAASFGDSRVQPLQIMDIGDYEKVMALAEAGHPVAEMLGLKTAGPYRDRDFAAWLHADPAAPSDEARLSVLKERWDAMGEEIAHRAAQAEGVDAGD